MGEWIALPIVFGIIALYFYVAPYISGWWKGGGEDWLMRNSGKGLDRYEMWFEKKHKEVKEKTEKRFNAKSR
jgi:hypothetical protein